MASTEFGQNLVMSNPSASRVSQLRFYDASDALHEFGSNPERYIGPSVARRRLGRPRFRLGHVRVGDIIGCRWR